MAIYIEKVDGEQVPITPEKALAIREAYLTQRFNQLSNTQAQFLDTIAFIQYTTEDRVCFHKYSIDKVVPMGKRGAQAYILRCCNCNHSFTTDMKPL